MFSSSSLYSIAENKSVLSDGPAHRQAQTAEVSVPKTRTLEQSGSKFRSRLGLGLTSLLSQSPLLRPNSALLINHTATKEKFSVTKASPLSLSFFLSLPLFLSLSFQIYLCLSFIPINGPLRSNPHSPNLKRDFRELVFSFLQTEY